MTKPEPAILIWLPLGEVPQQPSFSSASAIAYSSLPEALAAAYEEERLEVPWISTSESVYTPDDIRVMAATSMESQSDWTSE